MRVYRNSDFRVKGFLGLFLSVKGKGKWMSPLRFQDLVSLCLAFLLLPVPRSLSLSCPAPPTSPVSTFSLRTNQLEPGFHGVKAQVGFNSVLVTLPWLSASFSSVLTLNPSVTVAH